MGAEEEADAMSEPKVTYTATLYGPVGGWVRTWPDVVDFEWLNDGRLTLRLPDDRIVALFPGKQAVIIEENEPPVSPTSDRKG